MIKKNAKLWQALAESCETPAEFIRSVMALRKENTITLGKKLGTSQANISMAISEGHEPGIRMCYTLANALNIDPYLLNRVCQDYKMKKIIEKEQKK